MASMNKRERKVINFNSAEMSNNFGTNFQPSNYDIDENDEEPQINLLSRLAPVLMSYMESQENNQFVANQPDDNMEHDPLYQD